MSVAVNLVPGAAAERRESVPALSIGMPVYQDEKYLPLALDDLLAQSFADFELILSDNVSSDGTEEICRQYARRDKRIIYYRQTLHTAAIENFKFLLAQARAPYFMWAASDDRWHPDFVRQLLSNLVAHPSAASSFCRFAFIDDDGAQLTEECNFDFSGSSAYERVRKLGQTAHHARDGLFYGVHRAELLRRAQLRRWAWVNRDVVSGNAYPVVTCLLASGAYIHDDGEALWFNRLYFKKARRSTSGSPAKRWLFELIRNIDLFLALNTAVYRGSRSWRTTFALLPVVTAWVVRAIGRMPLPAIGFDMFRTRTGRK